MNYRIRIPQVRVIDYDGKQLGVMSTRDAQRLANDRGLDLVEVAPTVRPPVCRIMDYGRYKYEQNKKARTTKKKQHVTQVKEMHFRPKTDEHDYRFKLKHVREFLEEGDKVKVSVDFRGREMAHQEFGHKLVERLVKDVADTGQVEQRAKLEGRNLILLLAPFHRRAHSPARATEGTESPLRPQTSRTSGTTHAADEPIPTEGT